MRIIIITTILALGERGKNTKMISALKAFIVGVCELACLSYRYCYWNITRKRIAIGCPRSVGLIYAYCSIRS